MHSNYNVLTLPMAMDGKYKVGDTYNVPEISVNKTWKYYKFDGLTIKNIDYCYGVRLHFDFNEWNNNTPKLFQSTPVSLPIINIM
jgi:hypothetical protein